MSGNVIFIAHGPYGPDVDRALKDEFVIRWPCFLQPGQRALFSFTSDAAKELAFIVYRQGDMANVLEVGRPPYRDWNDRQITQTETYLLTAWQKSDAPLNWHQAAIRAVPPPAGYAAQFEVEDNVGDGDWDDIRVLVKII